MTCVEHLVASLLHSTIPFWKSLPNGSLEKSDVMCCAELCFEKNRFFIVLLNHVIACLWHGVTFRTDQTTVEGVGTEDGAMPIRSMGKKDTFFVF